MTGPRLPGCDAATRICQVVGYTGMNHSLCDKMIGSMLSLWQVRDLTRQPSKAVATAYPGWERPLRREKDQKASGKWGMIIDISTP
jgi:hypothetical protein